jgi:hypothetical protein
MVFPIGCVYPCASSLIAINPGDGSEASTVSYIHAGGNADNDEFVPEDGISAESSV